jgi:DNA uptake protein ComE-like DNA-binding protein
MHTAASLQTVSDSVRDFVNTNLEFVIAGLAIALGLLLILLAVIQRRRAEASEAVPAEGGATKEMSAAAPGDVTEERAQAPEPDAETLGRRERRRIERDERRRAREEERERLEREREAAKSRRSAERAAAKAGTRRAQRKRAREGRKRAKEEAKRRKQGEQERRAEGEPVRFPQALGSEAQGAEEAPAETSEDERLASRQEKDFLVGDTVVSEGGLSRGVESERGTDEAESRTREQLEETQRAEERIRIQAERRLREAERLQREAEARSERARIKSESQVKDAADRARRDVEAQDREAADRQIAEEGERARREAEERARVEFDARVADEAQQASTEAEASARASIERQIDRETERLSTPEPQVSGYAGAEAGDLASELEATEGQLAAEREARDKAIEDAYRRLREIEVRATEAEKRAVGAERLARLKSEEAERERRLREVLDSIGQAEERAREAERRAVAAELAAAKGISSEADEPPEQVEEPAPKRAESRDTKAEEAEPGPPSWLVGPDEEMKEAGSGARISLNDVTFEQLRNMKMSVTQATRVLAFREREGGFTSLDQLDKVPGFPDNFLEEIKAKLTV